MNRCHWWWATVLAAASCICGPAVAAEQFINVLTGGTSGVYYPLGVALASVIGKELPNVKTSAQATKASVENLNLLQAGRGEVAFTLGDSLSDAWKGNEEAGFKSPLKKLRGIAAIYPNYIQIVARADAGIKTLADLKGKKISVGAPKSGTELNARAILGAAGLSYKDFAKVEYLSFGESVELMKNRQLDVTLQSAGLGVASLKDLATSMDIVVVAVPPEVIKKVNDPAYIPTTIPANTYNGQIIAGSCSRCSELPRDARGSVDRCRLPCHEGALELPRPARQCARCSQGDRTQARAGRHAGASTPGR